MIRGEEVFFCPGSCPYVPDGVEAKVDAVRIPLDSEGRGSSDTARIMTVATNSSNPAVEVGDEALLVVARHGKSAEEIKADIARAMRLKGAELHVFSVALVSAKPLKLCSCGL